MNFFRWILDRLKNKDAAAATLIFIGQFLSLLWIAWPKFDEQTQCCLYNYFPLARGKYFVSPQWFWSQVFTSIAIAFYVAPLAIYMRRLRVFILIVCCLFLIEPVDYWLHYEEPYFVWRSIPVDFDVIRMAIIGCVWGAAFFFSLSKKWDTE